MGEGAVVGEDEQARRRCVEAAGGYEPGHGGHKVGHGRAAPIVGHGGQVSRRLVQGEVDPGLGETDGTAVQLDLVRRRHARAQVRRLAVDPHAARQYQRLGLAARGGRAGAGEERLQAHYEGSPPASSGTASEDARRSCTLASSSGATSESTGGKSPLERAPVAARNSSVTPRRAGEPGASRSVPTSRRRPRSIRLRTTASEFTPRTREMAPRVSGPRYRAQASTSWAAPESGVGRASSRNRSTAAEQAGFVESK